MQKLISKAELSRLCGVSTAAITKACKKKFPGAMHGDGQRARIDANHPAVIDYIESHGGTGPESIRQDDSGKDPSPERPPSKAAQIRDASPGEYEPVPDDIEAFADMTIRELIARFGTETRFKDWLGALKTIEDIQEKRIKNAVAAGKLVSRELVERHVFGVIEASHRRLLNDSPKTITGQVYAAAKSGMELEEAESKVRLLISSQLKSVKARAEKGLRNASK